MSEATIMAALSQPCDWCSAVVETLIQMQKQMYDRRNLGLFLTATTVDHDGKAYGQPTRVASIHVECRKCKGTHRVLTDQGVELVKLLVDAGVITAAELENRLSTKGGNSDGAKESW